jgi:pimeloyl-ACP methyl ester carboxylesterase
MLDQRAHGESTGVYCTAGYFERQDLSQVSDRLRTERPSDTGQIAVFGISMGGVTAIAVGAMRDDLAGIIADSPFGDYTTAGMLHARLFGFPGGFIQRPAAWVAQWISGARFAEVSPLRLVPQLRAPLLLIQPSHDMVISPEDAAELRQRLTDHPTLGDRSRAVIIPDAAHVLGLGISPELYEAEVRDFLERVLP